MPDSKLKYQPSLAEILLDKMGVDRSGVRPDEALELMLHVIDSECEPPPEGSAPQSFPAQPAAPSFGSEPEPEAGAPIFIADPQKVADFKRTLRARRSPRCRHRKVNGVRCGSPAQSGSSYCYFHYHIYTGDTQHLPVVEDGNSIAFVMGTIVRELASGRLEVPRANSMLYAMQNTAALLKYLDFEPDPKLLEEEPDEDPPAPLAPEQTSPSSATPERKAHDLKTP